MSITLDDLRHAPLERLESLYREERSIAIPASGSFDGTVLMRLHNPGADFPPTYWFQRLLFEAMPFGLNFFPGQGDWYFFDPKVAMGRFTPRIGPSRWRDTTTITLNYEASRFPGFFRDLLYDEIKPLSETLYLGIGGFNDERGKGDHFFFAIERR